MLGVDARQASVKPGNSPTPCRAASRACIGVCAAWALATPRVVHELKPLSGFSENFVRGNHWTGFVTQDAARCWLHIFTLRKQTGSNFGHCSRFCRPKATLPLDRLTNYFCLLVCLACFASSSNSYEVISLLLLTLYGGRVRPLGFR